MRRRAFLAILPAAVAGMAMAPSLLLPEPKIAYPYQIAVLTTDTLREAVEAMKSYPARRPVIYLSAEWKRILVEDGWVVDDRLGGCPVISTN